MAEQLGSLARTHTCGALRPSDVGKNAVLLGWVHRVRDLGSLLFLDVRDRHGLTQVIVEGDDALLERVKRIRSEFVVAVIGEVERRSQETINLSLPTGEVEVRAREVRILNEAKTPPFSIAEDQNVSEETRLKYRYLDLRRPQLQHNIGLRHRITMALRKYFDEQGFYEIETPILTKSTPEGARDFLVPARVHPGRVLRAAAVAADLQADPDDRRLRPLRADRALLPRRGAARGSPARIHAGRPRDVVRDAAARVRDCRGRAGRVFQGDRRRYPSTVQADAVRRGDGQVRVGQARSSLWPGDPGLRSALRAVAVRDLSRGRRARRNHSRVRDSRRRQVFAPRGR